LLDAAVMKAFGDDATDEPTTAQADAQRQRNFNEELRVVLKTPFD
jgi:hypothetical protein